MNSKISFVVLLAVIVLFSGCLTANLNDGYINDASEQAITIEKEPTQVEPVKSAKINDPVNEIDLFKAQIAKMTLSEKIGQMLLVGFKGYEINEELKRLIQNDHIGGVILFRNNVKNPDQLLALVNTIKETNSKSKVPLFISVDEEGGRISRMPEELHKLPSNQIIGEINNKDFSFKIGELLAEELKAFGFNMNFAPVLDIFSNPKNTVISDRAFGANAEIVSNLGIQTMKGIRTGGIIPVVKHFPGHGDTLVDSHVGLPSVTYDLEHLKSFELVPFKAAIDNQADAVMIAHILMNTIDYKNPASLSKIIITNILRKQMHFDGVVITDDMTMGAIEKNYQIGDAAVKSINAGSDIILVCHGYDNEVNVMDALNAAVEDGTIPEYRVDESVYRILKLKNKYKITDDKTVSINADEINKKIDAVLGKWYN